MLLRKVLEDVVGQMLMNLDALIEALQVESQGAGSVLLEGQKVSFEQVLHKRASVLVRFPSHKTTVSKRT